MKMATKLHEGKCGPCHCVNRKALNTHIWKKMDCVVAKLICDHFMQRSVVYAMHAIKQALPKAICSVDTCDETVYRNTNMASREQIENLVGQKLVTFAI